MSGLKTKRQILTEELKSRYKISVDIHDVILDCMDIYAKQVANDVGNKVLVDRATTRKINSSNDIMDLVLKLTEK